jgi:hypothetical protein
MHTIQLEISDQLAEKLAPYHDQLPRFLELGFQEWLERKRQERLSLRERLLQALATSGKVALPQTCTGEKPYVRHTPVPSTGKPVSEIVIEQRGPL